MFIVNLTFHSSTVSEDNFLVIDPLTHQSTLKHIAMPMTTNEIQLPSSKTKKEKSGSPKLKRRRNKTNEQVVAENEIRKNTSVWLPEVDKQDHQKVPIELGNFTS